MRTFIHTPPSGGDPASSPIHSSVRVVQVVRTHLCVLNIFGDVLCSPSSGPGLCSNPSASEIRGWTGERYSPQDLRVALSQMIQPDALADLPGIMDKLNELGGAAPMELDSDTEHSDSEYSPSLSGSQGSSSTEVSRSVPSSLSAQPLGIFGFPWSSIDMFPKFPRPSPFLPFLSSPSFPFLSSPLVLLCILFRPPRSSSLILIESLNLCFAR